MLTGKKENIENLLKNKSKFIKHDICRELKINTKIDKLFILRQQQAQKITSNNQNTQIGSLGEKIY